MSTFSSTYRAQTPRFSLTVLAGSDGSRRRTLGRTSERLAFGEEAVSCKKHSRVVGATLFAQSDTRMSWSASDLFSSSEISEAALSESFGVPFRFNGWFTTMLQIDSIIPLPVYLELC